MAGEPIQSILTVRSTRALCHNLAGLGRSTVCLPPPDVKPYLGAMTTAVGPLVERALPILRRHDVRRAGVFGSYARGEAGPESDLDLLVELPSGSSLLDLVGLEQALSDLSCATASSRTRSGSCEVPDSRALPDAHS